MIETPVISQNLVLSVNMYEFPLHVQQAIQIILEDEDEEYHGMAMRWTVFDVEPDPDCIYQTAEVIVNKFLLSQCIAAGTKVHIII